jgi:hypothetical protein
LVRVINLVPKIIGKPLTKLHVALYTEDVQFLRELYARDPGVNEVVRTAIHKLCTLGREQLRQMVDQMER